MLMQHGQKSSWLRAFYFFGSKTSKSFCTDTRFFYKRKVGFHLLIEIFIGNKDFLRFNLLTAVLQKRNQEYIFFTLCRTFSYSNVGKLENWRTISYQIIDISTGSSLASKNLEVWKKRQLHLSNNWVSFVLMRGFLA